ncbi:hypothetical protein M899_1651 [Bacteriovorax sp. BSW11_IV]|uniref:hypothetical protein n=1 Tax=Bacteriovorax sp. BSW11_IV TaxID=1353529 RepID=UPI00038A3F67|nr:hypothetical protein [Bacteriovorax sp. BSW11_IV]EQC49332.1 hypothetical protein M899_1651 [Bacteriovorax sp. BSW11_IV]
MSFRLDTPIYHCHHCKKILKEIGDLLFVESNSNRSFCSEKCIEKYFAPISEHYQKIVSTLRKDLHLENELVLSFSDDVHFMNKTCSRPDEIWRLDNKLGDEVFTLITKHTNDVGDFYHIVMCTLFDKSPAYIFMAQATSSEHLVTQFRIGSKIENVEEYLASNAQEVDLSDYGVDEEMLNELDVKKSSMLAELMVMQLPSDIQFEQFHLYEEYFEPTLSNPDQVYRFKDNDGDTMFSHIKAHEKNGISFYYIIVLLGFKRNDGAGDSLLPVMSFPTLDGQVCQKYRRGELIRGNMTS